MGFQGPSILNDAHERDARWEAERAEINAIENAELWKTIYTLKQALKAYNYHWPRKRPHGGGQAIGTAACGHADTVGAPCCRDCANKYINEALELLK